MKRQQYLRPVLTTAFFLLAMLHLSECCPKKIKTFFVGEESKERKVVYQGCFRGEAHHSSEEYPNMKLALCNLNCYRSGFKYMGVKGTKCFCETFLEKDTKEDDNLCETPCPGQAEERCGGEKHWAAYSTAPKYP